MAEAKERGYDKRVMHKLIVLRKRDQKEIAGEESILVLSKEILVMQRLGPVEQDDFCLKL